MKRVIFFSLISVLLLNTVLAEENVNTNTSVPTKEVMIFGDYQLRPKAEIQTTDTDSIKLVPVELKAPNVAEDEDVLQTIKIPMAEPDSVNEQVVKSETPTQNNNTLDKPVSNLKKETAPLVNEIDTANTVYKSEKEKLQELQTPDPDPETDEEKFAFPEVPEENEYMINLDVSEEQLFKTKTEVKKIEPEKIELEKMPIFNIPSQNHGATSIDNKISEKQMKGKLPSTKEYSLNRELALKERYSKETEDKAQHEEVLKTLHKGEKVVLDLKGRPLQYEDSGVSHSLVNIGTVFRF